MRQLADRSGGNAAEKGGADRVVDEDSGRVAPFAEELVYALVCQIHARPTRS
jgi:hypothetical protein